MAIMNYITRSIRHVQSIFTSQPTTSLGRWSTVDNHDIKASLANIDSCGDILCGDATHCRKMIDLYVKQKKVENSLNDKS